MATPTAMHAESGDKIFEEDVTALVWWAWLYNTTLCMYSMMLEKDVCAYLAVDTSW